MNTINDDINNGEQVMEPVVNEELVANENVSLDDAVEPIVKENLGVEENIQTPIEEPVSEENISVDNAVGSKLFLITWVMLWYNK